MRELKALGIALGVVTYAGILVILIYIGAPSTGNLGIVPGILWLLIGLGFAVFMLAREAMK